MGTVEQIQEILKERGHSVKEIKENPTVRKLTREVIQLASQRDPLDAIKDIELALAVLKNREEEWEKRLLEADK